MARSLRIIEPDLWHHVMNRGRRGDSIFIDDRDRETFLSLLGECGNRWGVQVAAYCLMSNHYHGLLIDELGNLSRAMRHIDGVYTQRFNLRHGSDGALMRGRFRSRVVQDEGYVAEVVRYIHFNPIDAGLSECAGDYRWSSHRVYLGQDNQPWCRYREVLALLGLEFGADAKLFDDFVHERVEAERSEMIREERWSPILGDEEFVAQCRAKVRESNHLNQPEIPEGQRLAAPDPNAVIDVACEHFGLSRNTLLRGTRGSLNLPRLLTLLECQRMTPASGADLGVLFGVGPRTVSGLVHRTRALVAKDEASAAELAALRRSLESKS